MPSWSGGFEGGLRSRTSERAHSTLRPRQTAGATRHACGWLNCAVSRSSLRWPRPGLLKLERQLNTAKTESLTMEGEDTCLSRTRSAKKIWRNGYTRRSRRVCSKPLWNSKSRAVPVEVMDRAEPSQLPVRPNLWLNISLGAVAGLILGIALAFFIEFLDTSVKKMEDVERYLGLPVLGCDRPERWPDQSRRNRRGTHRSLPHVAHQHRSSPKATPPATPICVLSAGAGEGKSLTIANLACVYAQHGARVLVVDSDLRRPSVHRLLGVSDDVGLG